MEECHLQNNNYVTRQAIFFIISLHSLGCVCEREREGKDSSRMYEYRGQKSIDKILNWAEVVGYLILCKLIRME